MRENWNTAVARPLNPSSTVETKKRKRVLFRGVSVGEKLVYLFSVIICVALTVAVISQYAKVTELNIAMSQVEKEIDQTKKVNLQLETEKKKMESVERIRKFAESKGLELTTPQVISSNGP